MKRVKKLAIGIVLLGQALSGAANAASATLSGTNFDFTYDDTFMGLFGQPTVAGDTLFFTPVNFDAKSLNGAGYAFNNDTINLKVMAHTGQTFNNVGVVEKGDYFLRGAGSTAEVGGQIRVFDMAKPLVDLTSNITTSSPLNVSSAFTKNWTANASVDVSSWNTARTLNVTLENLLLTSTTGPASLAFMEKKFVGLTFGSSSTVAAAAVPEAETYAMMLAGLGLVGFMVSGRRNT